MDCDDQDLDDRALDQCHSSTSARVDMVIDNNGTWEDAFQFGTPGDTTWSLTGQNFHMNVQLTPFDAAPLLALTSPTQIVVDDVTQRVVHLNVDKATLQAALKPGKYVYDLVMLDASNPAIRVPLMHGRVRVRQGVTQT